DDARRLMLAFDAGGHDFVIGKAHAVELQLAHEIQDVAAPHQLALLRRSSRLQPAGGAWRRLRAAGVRMASAGPGSRWRARMLRITSAEWTPWPRASRQAASTAASLSVSTAARIATIWRSPSSAPLRRRRTRSRPAGSGQSLNGAPFR